MAERRGPWVLGLVFLAGCAGAGALPLTATGPAERPAAPRVAHSPLPYAAGYAQFSKLERGAGGFWPSAGSLAALGSTIYAITQFGGGPTGQGLGAVVAWGTGGAGAGHTLYVFHGFTQGEYPVGGLASDGRGSLFGAQEFGGNGAACYEGCGAIFALQPYGAGGYRKKTLYAFKGGTDGGNPYAGVAVDDAGNLFGTTRAGGTATAVCPDGCGTVFELSPRRGGGYAERVIFRFSGEDGAEPLAALTIGEHGVLFGTTYLGGVARCGGGCGTVFRLYPKTDGTYAGGTIYRFAGNRDGMHPSASVALGRAGRIYGTTYEGGGRGACRDLGCGTVYQLVPAGGGAYAERVLHRFANGFDGSHPMAGLLLREGQLYGTTTTGGTSCGCGTVFDVSLDGRARTLHAFTGGEDGDFPTAGVIADAAGSLFGTTEYGGGGCVPNGCGTIFRIAR